MSGFSSAAINTASRCFQPLGDRGEQIFHFAGYELDNAECRRDPFAKELHVVIYVATVTNSCPFTFEFLRLAA